MYAIHVQSDQPDHPLVWQETPDPDFGPDDVLVEIHATALIAPICFSAPGAIRRHQGRQTFWGWRWRG